MNALGSEFANNIGYLSRPFYHDADVVHTFDRHDVSLASNRK
jgi:hypothetical protein